MVPKAVSFLLLGRSFSQTRVREERQAFHIWLHKQLGICKSPWLMGLCCVGECKGTLWPRAAFFS